MSGFGGKHRYITPEGYAELQAEIRRLWTVERPRVTREVSEAAAHGDRSENAEYVYGKRRLREIDRKLRELSRRLESCEVLDPRSRPADGRVGFGDWVTVEDESGQRARYRIVGADETRPEAGLISVDSPVGRVLLGRSKGDEVVVERPMGAITYEILEVERG